MDYGGFVVTGSRPPSALSSSRPGSAQGKRHGYHTITHQPSVDESLFRSHHPTRLDETFVNFKAPWDQPKPDPPARTFGVTTRKSVKVNETKKRGRPLLWCPPPRPASSYSKDKTDQKHTNSSNDCRYNTRDKFRHLKHTPTFVDETLFGNGLEEPTFEAPWNERKKGEKKKSKPYLWDPFGGFVVTGSNKAEIHLSGSNLGKSSRPATALGISRANTKGMPVPVWKP